MQGCSLVRDAKLILASPTFAEIPPLSLRTIRHYLSLIKFSHTVFALPFALIGLTLALAWEHRPLQWHVPVVVVLCMVFARSAAMAFNRYADARFDALNPRTAVREIPAGVIPAKHALLFTITSALLFVVCTAFLNPLCLALSPVALAVILVYSYTKRFTPLCHLVLGLGLALAPIGAYLAVTGFFDVLPLLFSGIVLTWVGAFDILYALQDEAFDREHKLHSIPVLLGRRNALRLSRALHVVTAGLVVATGVLYLGSAWYWTGALIFIGLLIYQHSLVSEHDISRINLAFGTANGIASVLYAAFVITGLILS
jgi:4-hydroxybenzoate polyprenyltransferase